MTATATRSNGSNGVHATSKLDAVVIGAGVAGLYQLFRLREQGLTPESVPVLGQRVVLRNNATGTTTGAPRYLPFDPPEPRLG